MKFNCLPQIFICIFIIFFGVCGVICHFALWSKMNPGSSLSCGKRMQTPLLHQFGWVRGKLFPLEIHQHVISQACKLPDIFRTQMLAVKMCQVLCHYLHTVKVNSLHPSCSRSCLLNHRYHWMMTNGKIWAKIDLAFPHICTCSQDQHALNITQLYNSSINVIQYWTSVQPAQYGCLQESQYIIDMCTMYWVFQCLSCKIHLQK